MRFLLLFLFVVLAFSCKTDTTANRANVTNTSAAANANKPANSSKQPATTAASVPVYTYEIVKTYKHDPNAFTEGLFFYNGFLYESTGQEKKSNLRKVELETGKVVQQYNLDKESFGEGTTILNGKIYQLTWQEGRAFVYDAATLKLIKEFQYQGEGWGLTNDGTNLIMDDGAHLLKFIDPETFQIVRSIPVFREDGKPLLQINELEFIKGEIWSNVWHSESPEILGKPNHIARIDPNSGRLLGWIDLSGISPDDVKRDPENTLNGIAYDAANDRIFVTGKNWKNLFEIKVKLKD